jgi:hypothetical protein
MTIVRIATPEDGVSMCELSKLCTVSAMTNLDNPEWRL